MILKDITKKYNRNLILDTINIDIDGGIYGLLGENGAGKSTLMKIMIGEIFPTNGTIKYDDNNTDRLEFYKSLGYLPQAFNAPKEMTVKNYLKYIATYKDIKKININKDIKKLSEELYLEEYLNEKLGNLSGGTIQRVGIAQAFINNPKFILLDEPSSGLDINQRKNLKNFISEHKDGKTIFISTHIISDIEYIVDHIIIIKSGKLIKQIKNTDAMNQLIDRVWEDYISEKEMDEFKKRLQSNGGVITNISRENSINNHVRYVCSEAIYNSAKNKSPELNDYYLWITERK